MKHIVGDSKRLVVMLLAICTMLVSCLQSKESQNQRETYLTELEISRTVTLEKAKTDIGDDCYIVAAKQKRDKTGYQVLITNKEDTHAILYEVYPYTPEYTIRELISSRGADATKELLNIRN